MYALKLKDILPRIDRNTPIAVFDDCGLISDGQSVPLKNLTYRSVVEYLDNFVRTISWNEDDHCIDIELYPFDTPREEI